ncbi:MAG TPA: glycosyltransferase family 39 protein [Armatimonadota bacterium]|nr:glycosyltransferase family 39 protein [Armatimonadota bacterium]
MKKLHVYLLICILLLAAFLRFAYIIKDAGRPLKGDEPSYETIAWNMAIGEGYQRIDSKGVQSITAVRGPSYVLFLTLIYLVFGRNVLAVYTMQALLDVGSCLLLFAICRLLFRRTDVPLVAALMYAVYAPFITNTQYILTETFTIFLTLLAVFGFLNYRMAGKLSWLYVSAVAVATATMAKPILALLPVLFFVAGYARLQRRAQVRDLAVQLAVVVLLMIPWTVRNALAFHAFIPTVSGGGITFWGGTGPANGKVVGGLGDPGVPSYVLRTVRGMSEPERDRWFYRDGLRIIRSEPKRYAALLMKKIPCLWFNLAYDTPPTKRNLIFMACNILVGLTAVLGIVGLKPPRFAASLLAWLVLYFTVMHMLFFSVFRYSLPVYAYMFCFSAGGVVVVIRRFGLVDRLLKRLDLGEEAGCP